MNDNETPQPIDAQNAPFVLQECDRDDIDDIFAAAAQVYKTTELSLNACFAQVLNARMTAEHDAYMNALNEGILGS